MEERSLKVYNPNTTFFGKISSALGRLFMPTRLGINNMLINTKRNNVIKYYDALYKDNSLDDTSKREGLEKRFDESYTLYLEAIDKYIMDSVYKKVKSGAATAFESNALSEYYGIVNLKDTDYTEYKYKKQKFLLELDYENFKGSGKEKQVEKFQKIYIEKMDSLYKGIIKNYSVKLGDTIKANDLSNIDVYTNIFDILEDYVKKVLPMKLDYEKDNENYENIVKGYEEYEKFSIGKLDEREYLEKNMILLGLSRYLFTHSLPLVAAEQCYEKLLRDVRSLIVKTKNPEKQEEAYKMLIKLIENYNVKLLSTKVYWDDPKEKEIYKTFWDKYSTEKDSEKKEILALKRELSQIENKGENNLILRKFYKEKLVGYGVMRTIKDSYKTYNMSLHRKV